MHISLRAILQILQRSVERKYNPLLSPQFRDKTNETITENGKVLALALKFLSIFDIPISFGAANIIIIVLLCPISAFLNQSYLLVYWRFLMMLIYYSAKFQSANHYSVKSTVSGLAYIGK